MISNDYYMCPYCPKFYSTQKQLNYHTPDCFKKHADNPPIVICPKCNADYTRKSGSAYRTHLKKCNIINICKSESAIKQSQRRKEELFNVTCNHCNTTFEKTNVGQFSDHKYKCKKKIPNYNKEYQDEYRSTINDLKSLVYKYYPDINKDYMLKVCRILRKKTLVYSREITSIDVMMAYDDVNNK